MLDADDIRIISEIVREAISDNNKTIRADMATMRKELRAEIHADMMTLIESEINPKLRLLAEGHEALNERLDRLERQDELTGRVVILEEAVKKLNKEMSALQKAQ